MVPTLFAYYFHYAIIVDSYKQILFSVVQIWQCEILVKFIFNQQKPLPLVLL